MKKTVKLLALVLAVVMAAACFAGCSAGQSKKIIIGATGPLTGDAATYGTSVNNGAQIAIDEINAAGGVNGIELELKFQDDEATGDKAKTAYEKLADDGMQIFMGAVTSTASLALNDLVKEDGILQITPSASHLNAVDNSNSFRICFIDPTQGIEMARYAKNTAGYTNAAVIYNQDDSYSTGIYDAFKKEWAALGGVISVETSFAGEASDFSAQMTKVKSSDAQFLFMPIYAEKAAAIVLAAHEKAVELPILGCDGLDGILNYLTGDNAGLVEGLIYLTPFVASDTDSATTAFVNTYKEKYGASNVPDQFAADGYDAIYTIKAALEKANVTSADSLDNAALISAMTQIEVKGLTGNMTWSSTDEPTKEIKFAKIVNGTYVLL